MNRKKKNRSALPHIEYPIRFGLHYNRSLRMGHRERSQLGLLRACLMLLFAISAPLAIAQTTGDEEDGGGDTATPTAATTTKTATTTQPAATAAPAAAPAVADKKPADDGKGKDDPAPAAAPSGDHIQGYPIFSVYTLDLSTMQITAPAGSQTPNARNLPFDVPFLLSIKNTTQVKTLNLGLHMLKDGDMRLPIVDCKKPDPAKDTVTCKCGCGYNKCLSSFKRQPLMTGDVVVTVPALRANRFYTMCLDITSMPSKLDSVKLRAFLVKTIIAQVANHIGDWKTNPEKHDNTLVNVASGVKDALTGFLNLEFKDRQGYTAVTSNADQVLIKDRFDLPIWKSFERLHSVLVDQIAAAGSDTEFLKKLFGNDLNEANLTGMYEPGTKDARLTPELSEVQSSGGIAKMTAYLTEELAYVKKAQSARTPKVGKEPKDQKEKAALEKDLKTFDSMVTFIERLLKDLDRHKRVLESVSKTVEVLADRLMVDLMYEIQLTGSTSSDFKTRASWYLAPDVGYAFVYGDSRPIQQTPYFGIELHMTPINREANYSFFSDRGIRNAKGHKTTWKGLGMKLAKSISFSAAITGVDINKVEGRKGVIGDQMGLMLGGGLRLNEFLRVGCGSLVTQRKAPYPLSTDYVINSNFYWGVSIDIDLIGYVQRIAAARAGK